MTRVPDLIIVVQVRGLMDQHGEVETEVVMEVETIGPKATTVEGGVAAKASAIMVGRAIEDLRATVGVKVAKGAIEVFIEMIIIITHAEGGLTIIIPPLQNLQLLPLPLHARRTRKRLR